VIAAVYITASWLVLLKWTRTSMTYFPPDIQSLTTENQGFCKIFGHCILQVHSFFSSYVAPKKGNTYVSIPQYNQMIFTHVYFFLGCILVEFIMDHNDTTEWTTKRIAKVDLLIFFVFLAIKTLIYSINYFLYFRNYPFPSPKDKKQQRQITEQINLQAKDNKKQE